MFFSFSRQNHAESFRNLIKKSVLDPKCAKLDQKSEHGGKAFGKSFFYFFDEKWHFQHPDSVFWWFLRAHEFPGRKMMQNDLEISSRTQFWTPNIQNWTQTLIFACNFPIVFCGPNPDRVPTRTGSQPRLGPNPARAFVRDLFRQNFNFMWKLYFLMFQTWFF